MACKGKHCLLALTLVVMALSTAMCADAARRDSKRVEGTEEASTTGTDTSTGTGVGQNGHAAQEAALIQKLRSESAEAFQRTEAALPRVPQAKVRKLNQRQQSRAQDLLATYVSVLRGLKVNNDPYLNLPAGRVGPVHRGTGRQGGDTRWQRMWNGAARWGKNVMSSFKRRAHGDTGVPETLLETAQGVSGGPNKDLKKGLYKMKYRQNMFYCQGDSSAGGAIDTAKCLRMKYEQTQTTPTVEFEWVDADPTKGVWDTATGEWQYALNDLAGLRRIFWANCESTITPERDAYKEAQWDHFGKNQCGFAACTRISHILEPEPTGNVDKGWPLPGESYPSNNYWSNPGVLPNFVNLFSRNNDIECTQEYSTGDTQALMDFYYARHLKLAIDNHRPTIILIRTGGLNWHYIVVVGYAKNPSASSASPPKEFLVQDWSSPCGGLYIMPDSELFKVSSYPWYGGQYYTRVECGRRVR